MWGEGGGQLVSRGETCAAPPQEEPGLWGQPGLTSNPSPAPILALGSKQTYAVIFSLYRIYEDQMEDYFQAILNPGECELNNKKMASSL